MKNNGEKLEGLMIAAMLLNLQSLYLIYCQQRRKRQKSLHLMQVTRT